MGIDWVITVLAIASKQLSVNKNKWCWAVSGFNCILWTALCVKKEMWGLMPLNAINMYFAVVGWIKWSK